MTEKWDFIEQSNLADKELAFFDYLRVNIKKDMENGMILSVRRRVGMEDEFFNNNGQECANFKLQTLDDFSKISGLRLNAGKTEPLWIGSKVGQEKISVPEKDLKWPKYKVKMLDLWLSTDPDLAKILNYKEKTEKIRKLLSCWKYRRLTLLGKMTVLKSLIASQLVYLFVPLPSNHYAIKELNDMFYYFLWNGKGDKIKRKVMINEPGNGGLKMIDLCSFNKSLKTTWVKKYFDTTNNGKWKLLFDDELKTYS